MYQINRKYWNLFDSLIKVQHEVAVFCSRRSPRCHNLCHKVQGLSSFSILFLSSLPSSGPTMELLASGDCRTGDGAPAQAGQDVGERISAQHMTRWERRRTHRFGRKKKWLGRHGSPPSKSRAPKKAHGVSAVNSCEMIPYFLPFRLTTPL